MRRQTNKSRNCARNNVLHARVWSPRLLRIGIFKFLYRCIKPVCVLAILGGLGWGVQRGLQRAFYNNPDFRLQAVELNPNPAIDELDFVRNIHVRVDALDRAVHRVAAAHFEHHLHGEGDRKSVV